MRAALFALLTIAGVSALGASPASAERSYPYCMRTFGPTGHVECDYSSLQQCKASASGRAAECYRDPFYPAYDEPRQRHRHYYR